MRQRRVGPDMEAISEIGLGAWQIGSGWGPVAEPEALATIEAALEAGVTFFDTADVYGDGRSERLLGRVLAGRRERAFVATKVGRAHGPDWPGSIGRDMVRRNALASLERLGRDSHDLLLLHTLPAAILKTGEPLAWLAELQAEGLVRHFGASVESVDEALYCLDVPGLAALEIIFNIFRQTPAERLFAAARQRGVALIARVPLASGLLTGKLTPRTTFAASDHRRFNRDGRFFNVGETFAGLPLEKGLELVEELRAMRPRGMTLGRMSLRFVLDHPEVTAVIPGARRPGQIRDNAAASDAPPLSPELHARLRAFFRERVAPFVRGPD